MWLGSKRHFSTLSLACLEQPLIRFSVVLCRFCPTSNTPLCASMTCTVCFPLSSSIQTHRSSVSRPAFDVLSDGKYPPSFSNHCRLSIKLNAPLWSRYVASVGALGTRSSLRCLPPPLFPHPNCTTTALPVLISLSRAAPSSF